MRNEDFRLLHIEPMNTDEQMTCGLLHTAFSIRSHYKALSYVWDSNEKSHVIYCGKLFRTTANLFPPQRRFRDLGILVIWADAICCAYFLIDT
jgi:hypothetical protein